MRALILIFNLILFTLPLKGQDYYDRASSSYSKNDLDSARFYIGINLSDKPSAADYFLSAMIHESEGKSLRALADYEAVIKKDAKNIEAYFQKGLIYFNTSSFDKAIEDFTYVINNHEGSETRAIYYGQDPSGAKGTFLTTLQSMISRVYQYRGMAYQRVGDLDRALDDFTTAFTYEENADSYINRSQLYAKMGREEDATDDLRSAIRMDSANYTAWYNLAILDEEVTLPPELVENEAFAPMLNLVGANAYEIGDFETSISYHSKAIEINNADDLAYVSRGKALLRNGSYARARRDFIKAMQLEPSRIEAFYLIGNTLFHERNYQDAVGFYEQYLSIDAGYGNVWFNAAMAYLSLGNQEKACEYLQKARSLGIKRALEIIDKQCDRQ